MQPTSVDTPFLQSRTRIHLAIAALALLTIGCRSHSSYQINLMPAPEVYATGTVDPFAGSDSSGGAELPYSGILYATDREPSQTEGAFYANRRGALLRLGLANVVSGENNIDWVKCGPIVR
jgi:hypothetical protein